MVNSWKPLSTLNIYQTVLEPKLLGLIDDEFSDNLRDAFETISKLNDKKIGYEDLAGILYINSKVNGIQETYDYLVIDEAQDFSPFQMYYLKLISKSMTILGDITQSIFPEHGIEKWEQLISSVFTKENVKQLNMTTSYRSTFEIMELANQILKNSESAYPKVIPINRKGKLPKIDRFINGNDLITKLVQSIDSLKKNQHKRVAVITKDQAFGDALFKQLKSTGVTSIQLISSSNSILTETIVIAPCYMIKGLEFDAVIIPNASHKTFGLNALDTKLLFVSITRAHHELHIYYHEKITPLLDGYVGDTGLIEDKENMIDSLL